MTRHFVPPHVFFALLGLLLTMPTQADEVAVAVAAHFARPMQKIAKAFEQDTGHKARLAFGATGKFYAQIKNAAPFAVLLAADTQTPERLEQEGLAVAGTRQTYAIGRLVLWSQRADVVDAQGEVLRTQAFNAQKTQGHAVAASSGLSAARPKVSAYKIAMADPKTSPYGAAARAVMQRLDVWAALQPQLVQGESVGQAFQFVSTGNAQLGFVALSQLKALPLRALEGDTPVPPLHPLMLSAANPALALQAGQGSAWLVPPHWHSPLKHDAVLLRAGQHNEAAKALLAYLQSARAQAIMRDYGYSL